MPCLLSRDHCAELGDFEKGVRPCESLCTSTRADQILLLRQALLGDKIVKEALQVTAEIGDLVC